MENTHFTLRPIELARCLHRGEISEDDVIRWAEVKLATTEDLEDEGTIIELAALAIGGDNSDTVRRYLEQLISSSDDFAISQNVLDAARTLADALIVDARPSSITNDNCIDYLLGCCPEIAVGLAKVWRFFGADEAGLYDESRPFITFIVSAIQDSTDDLDHAIQCLESLFTLGDSEIREVATVGIIEGVVNRCRHNDIDLAPLIERLLPESRLAYDELERFWTTDHWSQLDR